MDMIDNMNKPSASKEDEVVEDVEMEQDDNQSDSKVKEWVIEPSEKTKKEVQNSVTQTAINTNEQEQSKQIAPSSLIENNDELND